MITVLNLKLAGSLEVLIASRSDLKKLIITSLMRLRVVEVDDTCLVTLPLIYMHNLEFLSIKGTSITNINIK